MAMKTKKKREDLPPLPDQNQRDQILKELARNCLVEAAAGTGKTTSMVGRMVALLGAGQCEIRTLAAVTFTRKAAAQLRGRFQVSLEKALREASGPEKERFDRARAKVEQCFIGTIHSFCARLLRERPVEAGVDLSFEEIDEDADLRLRREAWDEYGARLLADDPNDTLAELDKIGLRLGDLENAFLRFANYPDVDEWPVSRKAARLPNLKPVVKKIREYVTHMEALAPKLPLVWGNDGLIPAFRDVPRIISHYDDLLEPRQLMEVLALFGKKSLIQKEWKKTGAFTREQAKAEGARWDRFRADVTEPLVRAWQECRYEPILRVMKQAQGFYDRLRRERGQLNFQDLLLTAAKLLANQPHIRRYFRGRFTHLLVDEFQDTDPIQAEVMLLLTATNLEETNWRNCMPRPGSLFVVGDPKQSIYRFRRADIVTYNEVKEIIRRGDGKRQKGLIVQLSTNFRSTGSIINWVNQCFTSAFPPEGSNESPAYVALQQGRGDGNTGDLSEVHRLLIPAAYSNQQDAIEYDADRIARTIRQALDSGLTVSRTKQEIEAGRSEQVAADDFMILTRNRKNLSVYARKLQEVGVPHQVTGGIALNEVDELGLLHTCLTAVVHPDNPVALVAALRSELFGVSDVALYAFKKAKGTFSYNSSVPASLQEQNDEYAAAFTDAFKKLKTYSRWLAKFPPVAAIEKIIADLGLLVQASIREGGDVDAGSLCKALELLRQAQDTMWTAAELVDYLGTLVEAAEPHDGISARSEEPPAVRIMNLHKVKGLEAPIVFLADPSGESDHPVDLHIDRSGNKVLGYMALLGERRGHRPPPVMARPVDWDALVEKEKRFQDAEAVRLRYVAATRAGSALIVTQREKKNGRNPWQHFSEYLPKDSEIADPGEQAAPVKKKQAIAAKTITAAHEEIAARFAQARRPTYQVRTAKEYALSHEGAGAGQLARGAVSFAAADVSLPHAVHDDGEHGVEWGTVIHQLLELASKTPQADLDRLAQTALPECGLDAGLAGAAVATVRSVTKSEIWKRALESDQRFTEIPFQILLDGNENEKDESAPTILRGAIDLIFKESDGWVLVDYKTDKGDHAKLLETYAPQLGLYSRCWEQITGERVKEQGLFFSRTSTYYAVSRAVES